MVIKRYSVYDNQDKKAKTMYVIDNGNLISHYNHVYEFIALLLFSCSICCSGGGGDLIRKKERKKKGEKR